MSTEILVRLTQIRARSVHHQQCTSGIDQSPDMLWRISKRQVDIVSVVTVIVQEHPRRVCHCRRVCELPFVSLMVIVREEQ